jgi:NADP-dependent 3-hydroxy acid dehydrogenase YdfG
VWVNDAMATVFSDVPSLAPSEPARAMEVTFLGQAYGTMAALAVMTERDTGTIVNIDQRSHSSAFRSNPHTARQSSRVGDLSIRLAPN